MLRALIASRPFQRLRDIVFPGAIDHLFHPNGKPAAIRHNRFDHSPDHVHCHPALLVEASARPDERGLRRLDDFWHLTETGFIRKYPGFGDFLADLRHRIALKGAEAVLRAPPPDLTPVPERAFLIRRGAKVATHADLCERHVECKDIIRRRIATLGEKTVPARMGRLDL